MIKVYPAIFHLEDGSYWVEFPDFDGCFSDGETLEDALMNAQEALGAHLGSLLDSKQTLPEAHDLKDIVVTDALQVMYLATLINSAARTRQLKKPSLCRNG